MDNFSLYGLDIAIHWCILAIPTPMHMIFMDTI